MFKSALVKLTCIYLGVIMAISLFFSATIFQLASRELGRGYRNQVNVIDNDSFNVPQPLQQRLEDVRSEFLDEARSRLLTSLFFTNLAILMLGGALSYVLARKTLQPIEVAHQSLEQFTADASHELRTPLAAMQSEIEVALMQKKLSATEAKEVLESNLEEVASLTKLSDNLLSLARLEEPNLEIVACDIEGALNSAVKKVSATAKAKSQKIAVEVNQKDLKALADKNALEQILVALLDNAIKYSAPKKQILLRASQQRGAVAVAIIDEGAGIKKEQQAKVFDRFYQADDTRSKQQNKGHGLGLAIVKQLLEKQSGSVTLESKVGSGSTFTIFLPKA